MHPVFVQAMAAERIREIRADAVAAGHARRLRGSRRIRRGGRLTAIPQAGGGPARPATRPLRDPRAA